MELKHLTNGSMNSKDINIQRFIEYYEKAKDSGKCFDDFSVMELIGYYLKEYPTNPVDKFLFDRKMHKLPTSKTDGVRLMLTIIGG